MLNTLAPGAVGAEDLTPEELPFLRFEAEAQELFSVTDSLLAVGLELVWMMAVIDLAGPQRTAQYVAIGATLAGVRGVVGPLVGGLLIHAFGVHAVYLVAAILTLSGAWLVGRELRIRIPAPAFTR